MGGWAAAAGWVPGGWLAAAALLSIWAARKGLAALQSGEPTSVLPTLVFLFLKQRTRTTITVIRRGIPMPSPTARATVTKNPVTAALAALLKELKPAKKLSKGQVIVEQEVHPGFQEFERLPA